MSEAAKQFAGNPASNPAYGYLITVPIDPRLTSVADSFVELQEQRHKADYDVTDRFDRARAQNAVARARSLIADWNAVRNSDNARVFLSALLFGNTWKR